MAAPSAVDPAVQAAVARFGRSALAWEVLRRDPDYRAAFSRVNRADRPGVGADPAFVTRWGLHFP